MKFNTYHKANSLAGYSFLITGGAGFIGSNIVEYLVQHNAGHIRILDNLSTGNINNIQEFLDLPNVAFVEGDIRSYHTCEECTRGIDFISHQAALGSVPRSIHDPVTTNEVNITGFLNMLTAAKEAGIQRFVYAASSSTYGDSKILPKKEDVIGNPLSPYAVTKYVNELYAQVFSRIYNFHTVGLRYFNVFGPKQNLNGPYAAVIPLFISQMLKHERPCINGTGETSRDFTFVSNVVQANIKALFKDVLDAQTIINIACGDRTTLVDLVNSINEDIGTDIEPEFLDFRPGDVMHSMADISKAQQEIEYAPEVFFKEGISLTIPFFRKNI